MIRREMIRRSGMGMGVIGLTGLLNQDHSSFAQGPEVALPRVKAKHVIHFFFNGGPSHVDTFDPKPALNRFAGKPVPNPRLTERKTGAAFPSPFKFRRYGQSGLEISELFEQTARHADDIAVIRSMYAQVPNHEPSLMLMNCGDSVQARPSLGSWLMYGLGSENQNLPGFIAMCPGGMPIKGAENWQSAFLPGAMQGTYVDSNHTTVERLIENIRNPQSSFGDQRKQLDLLQELNQLHRRERQDMRLEARMESFELAFRMQTAATDAFDLDDEPQYVRDMYGSGVHGRQTLIARRLIERGVRMVQLWHGAGQPWDNHENIEQNHRKLAAEIDRPIAALIGDLKQRGLLDETLIIWGGEFGRTPTVELSGNQPKLGRDHNHYGFSVCLAGAGIRGGVAYGSTDEFGFAAQENPTSVHDLHATILYLMGLDHRRLTYRYAGRDFRLTDVYGNVLHPLLS